MLTDYLLHLTNSNQIPVHATLQLYQFLHTIDIDIDITE